MKPWTVFASASRNRSAAALFVTATMLIALFFVGWPATAQTPAGLAAADVSASLSPITATRLINQALTDNSAPVSTTRDSGVHLSFDLPAASTHKKLVFAHYFTPYPVSMDNKAPSLDYYTKNYLLPSGESGKFASVGGLLRDRPIGRDPVTGDWKFEDLKAEIRQAQNAGIDGWAIDVLNVTGTNWDRVVRMIDAADAIGNFRVMLMLDMNGSTGSADTATLAAKLAPLARRPSIYKLGTGDFVLSAFKAENKTVDWWKTLIATMQNSHGLKVNFIPCLLDANTYMDRFAPISYAIGNWGVRNPGVMTASPNYAQRAHALGVKWMAPVSIQDERPNQKIYDEAGNTEALRASWQRAIDDQADLVQLTTWNDYSEGTSFAPSEGHGYSFLDISAYLMSRFQTGQAPSIVRDAVYLTHRVQKYATAPTTQQQLMALRASSSGIAARDTVEVLTYLTAPANITVTVGNKTYSYGAPAGIVAKLFPLDTGRVTATAERSGSATEVADSPHLVTAAPQTQDLAYYASSSYEGANQPPASSVSAVRTDAATVAFVRGTDNGVWFRSTVPGAGYFSLGGTIRYGPAVASWGGNRLDVFAVGSDGSLFHRAGSDMGSWGGWERLGGSLTASPAAVSFSPNTLTIFGRGADNQLWTIAWTGAAWTSWSPLGGTLTSAPGAALDRNTGKAKVGVRGTDGKLFEFGCNANRSGAYSAIGTPLFAAPAYATRSGGGTISALLNKDLSLSVDAHRLGGTVTSAPAVVVDTAGSVSAFGRGGDGALWMYRGVPGAGSWTSLGGTLS